MPNAKQMQFAKPQTIYPPIPLVPPTTTQRFEASEVSAFAARAMASDISSGLKIKAATRAENVRAAINNLFIKCLSVMVDIVRDITKMIICSGCEFYENLRLPSF
jgi:hypothetical protein